MPKQANHSISGPAWRGSARAILTTYTSITRLKGYQGAKQWERIGWVVQFLFAWRTDGVRTVENRESGF